MHHNNPRTPVPFQLRTQQGERKKNHCNCKAIHASIINYSNAEYQKPLLTLLIVADVVLLTFFLSHINRAAGLVIYP